MASTVYETDSCSGDIDSGDAVLTETSERENVTRGLAARQAPKFEKMAEISSFW